jgi:hypothetical protein
MRPSKVQIKVEAPSIKPVEYQNKEKLEGGEESVATEENDDDEDSEYSMSMSQSAS